ncbi:MAG TPA: outer membrane protein transport protein, partial [Candidatus Nanopelagicales bacterium]|nr:outer membrane protein transport protein [Candidatus Nanopelagicales bacterium]
MKNTIVRASATALVLAVLAPASTARAGGLYVADRGVRPLARGGAFVAGADDPGAMAYNPAGLFDSGTQFLVDASWVQFSSDYTRQSRLRQVDPNTGETVGSYLQTFDEVSGSAPFLPIPTLAASIRLAPEWALGFGVWAPYAALAGYPEEVNGEPAPQRYALYNLDGSALAFLGAGVAYAPSPAWRFGAVVSLLVGTFNSQVAFSGCVPERFLCAPEDPDWDVAAQLGAGPIIAPTGQLGVQWIPSEQWRVGLSFQLPVWVRTGGTLRTRLPATPVFEQASQEGEDVDVAFDLPFVLRLGVETRAVEDLRLEVGFAWEHWSMHDAIEVTSDELSLRNVAGFPDPFYLPPVTLQRNFQDSVSVRAGGEYGLALGDKRLDVRGGLSFETSAVPAEYLTVLTLDAPKVTASLGAGLTVGR